VVQEYARCLDARDWDGLAAVLTDDASANYGGYPIVGRATLVSWISGFLGGCGPSQHLLGYHVASTQGDRGSCETQVRVLHLPADKTSGLMPYESVGTYHDELVRTPAGWRISHRTFEVRIEVGDRAVLRPAR
jgi:hypothetical protein